MATPRKQPAKGRGSSTKAVSAPTRTSTFRSKLRAKARWAGRQWARPLLTLAGTGGGAKGGVYVAAHYVASESLRQAAPWVGGGAGGLLGYLGGGVIAEACQDDYISGEAIYYEAPDGSGPCRADLGDIRRLAYTALTRDGDARSAADAIALAQMFYDQQSASGAAPVARERTSAEALEEAVSLAAGLTSSVIAAVRRVRSALISEDAAPDAEMPGRSAVRGYPGYEAAKSIMASEGFDWYGVGGGDAEKHVLSAWKLFNREAFAV